MSPLFSKLNLGEQREILAVNAPPSLKTELQALDGVTVLRDPTQVDAVRFSLAFATQQAEVDRLSDLLAAKARGDACVWFACPKGTSKNYRCDFNATPAGRRCAAPVSTRSAT